MTDLRSKREKRKIKRKEHPEKYGKFDFFLDILLWIPEIIILPFRMVYWLFRGIGRMFDSF